MIPATPLGAKAESPRGRGFDGSYDLTDLKITQDTKVSEILDEYGDIADVMEALGMKRVGGLSLRRIATKAITVKRAARIHRVPVEELLDKLHAAVTQIESEATDDGT